LLVRHVSSTKGLHESPDVIVAPPLLCGTGLSFAELWRIANRDEWVCRWCDLQRHRLGTPQRCPYCGCAWKTVQRAEFRTGEPYLVLACTCLCEARWYPQRGWGESCDRRLVPNFMDQLTSRSDPGICGWCGAPTFEFMHRPDGFFRRCTECKA